MASVLLAGDGFTVDSEFAELGPPLTPEERNLLLSSIDSEGCREALIVWKEEGLLLDGHNRFEICTELDKPYRTKQLSLPNREAAVEWVIQNQLGRRNLPEEQKEYLRGKRYRQEKKAQHRPPKEKGVQSDPLKTAERLAKEYDVSPATIKRDAKFSEAVDTIAKNVGKQAKDEILTGKSGLSKKDVVAVADEPAEQQSAAIERLRQKVGGSLKSEFDVLVERINKAIHTVEEMAASRMGQCSYSRAILASLGDAAKKAEAWRKKQEKE